MDMKRFLGAAAVAVGISGCAGNPASVPHSTMPQTTVSKPTTPTGALPERVATAPIQTFAPSAAVPQSIDLGAYDQSVSVAQPERVETVSLGSYDQQAAPAPVYTMTATAPRGTMAPVRDDPVGALGVTTASRATTYNIAALKAAYHPSEALQASAPPAQVRNAFTPAFGQQLASAAIARLNPNVAYVADYKEISYPWGDVPESTGVCTDVVIRSYRSLGIDLQSLVHEDMRRAFSAYPSRKIYGLTKADPNIDHRRVVNLEAFFERVGASIPVGSDYQPGDVITWRLSGGEPHIGVVVNRTDPSTGNLLIVHNLGGGVRAEDLLDFAPPHGHYRFAPDAQSRMASLALKRG